MALSWKVRAVFRAQAALTKLRVLPDSEKLLTLPVAKRLAMGPGKGLVGKVPAVGSEERTITTRDGDTIRLRVYRPADPTDQPLLYLHGGGFVVGGIASCDHICRRLAHESGAVVVSVEYRLAPEHRFPVPLHDCLDAADWVVAQADELGVDPAKLVVGGDSAGGNLAAALAVVFRDEGRVLAGQLLVYPFIDLSLSLPGVEAYRGLGLHVEEGRLVAAAYLGDHDPTDPYASPWYADPAGLAPAFVVTVDNDALQHEGIAYAEKLLAAGVPVEHVDLVDHVHGSLSIPALYQGIDEVHESMASFVRRVAVTTS
jgi:acetyl esterase